MPENAPSAQSASPAPKQKSRLTIVILFLAVLGVVLVGASLATTWYVTKSTTGSTTVEAKEDFSGYDTNGVRQAWGDMNGVNNSKALYSQTEMLVVAGVVMDVLLLVGAALLMKSPGRKMAVGILGIIAAVVTLLGPAMFAAGHAPAWKSDAGSTATGDGPWSSFFGSTTSGSFTMSWGPSTGWWLAILGFIFVLVGALLVFMVEKPEKAG